MQKTTSSVSRRDKHVKSLCAPLLGLGSVVSMAYCGGTARAGETTHDSGTHPASPLLLLALPPSTWAKARNNLVRVPPPSAAGGRLGGPAGRAASAGGCRGRDWVQRVGLRASACPGRAGILSQRACSVVSSGAVWCARARLPHRPRLVI